MAPETSGFGKRVVEVVAGIPAGKVMTYGQIAALCGSARASRVVGGIAHYGNPELPWHRVVNLKGMTATGYWGGAEQQQKHLEAEGVVFGGDPPTLDLAKHLYQPNHTNND
jgi:methylated-DNA-protein-cysteine methyltransferase related protein